MKLALDSTPPTSTMVSDGRAGRGDSSQLSRSWRLLVAVAAAGLALQAPVQAKPIAGCLVQEADLLDPTSCLSPPEHLTATRPTNQTRVIGQPDQIARVTLEPAGKSAGAGSNSANCSALRGTHEAQSLMLKTVQEQLSSVERDRRSATGMLRTLRGSGANELQLTSAANRLTKINAVWGALRGDVEKRTKSFNNSMSRLTKACLRG